MTSTPMEAPDYASGGMSMSDSFRSVVDNIIKDEEVRTANALRQSALPQELAKFSKTASDLGQTLFSKRLEEIKAKGLHDARLNGSITQEQIDAYDLDVNDINSDHRTIEKAASSIEKSDQHDIVAERVRSTDPYYQYYFKLGQLRDEVQQLPAFYEQLKNVLTIEGEDGKPIAYEDIREYDDYAAWNSQASLLMNKAFAGVNPVLAAKEIFPTLDDIFTSDAQKWAKTNAARRKQERKDTQQNLLVTSIISRDPEKIKTAFETSDLTRAELFEGAQRLAKIGALDFETMEALRTTQIRDRATGKMVSIGDKFEAEMLELEFLQTSGDRRATDNENYFKIQEYEQVAREDIEAFKDQDGVTLDQVKQLEEKFLSYNDPLAASALKMIRDFKEQAIDYYDQEEVENMYRNAVIKIDKGQLRAEDIEKNYGGDLRVRLRNYLKQEGKYSSANILDKYETAFTAVESDVKNIAGVTAMTGGSGSVDLEIQHQKDILQQFLTDLEANPNLSDAERLSEALTKWKKQWESSLDKEGYFTEGGFPGAYSRVPVDEANVRAGIERIERINKVVSQNKANGIDPLENHDRLYTPEQFGKAVQDFKNGDVDPITRLLARHSNRTPMEVLQQLAPMFNVELPPIAPQVQAAAQQLTTEQKARLITHPSERRLQRFRGRRTLVGDVNLERLRESIIGQESGGNPQAVHTSGPDPTGAAGLGQILPENIPQWSREILGEELSYEEFMRSPDKQIQIIDGKLEQYLNEEKAKGYTGDILIRRVASRWYSGLPNLYDNPRGQGPDGTEPSIRNYTTNILDRYSSFSQASGGKRSFTGALTYKDNKDSYHAAGDAFKAAGFSVGEHSAFGGTAPVHASNSFHNYDEAFDITHQTGDYNASIEKTARLQDLIERLDLFHEVIGPRSNDPKHKTHLHLGGLKRPLTAEDIRLINSIK